MERLNDGQYKMSKIDMIKMCRAVGNQAVTLDGPNPYFGLKETKDAVEDYLLLEAAPYEVKSVIENVRQLVLNRPELTSAVTRQFKKMGIV